MFYDQATFDVRFEWGEPGVERLSAHSDVIVVVDVLSFSTCVDIATGNGAVILPYRWKDSSAVEFARRKQALLASFERRYEGRYSLAPSSLVDMPAGTRLVLPSPNGSTLALRPGDGHVLAGCLRNATSVAKHARGLGDKITLIAAGERWDDGGLRPCAEDLIGAGAIAACLAGGRSPEAEAAVAAFRDAQADPAGRLRSCASGRELIERGFEDDVELASELDCSETAPLLRGGEFTDISHDNLG